MKIKEDNRKEKKFIPPTLEEVEKYVLEKKLQVNAKSFYDYFTEGNWIDNKGNQVRSWKQKILTWNSYGKSKTTKKVESNYEQREYSNLDFLYKNKGVSNE